MADVLLIYADADRAVVDVARRYLQDEQVSLWGASPPELFPRDNLYEIELERHADLARVALVFWSDAARRSLFVQHEIRTLARRAGGPPALHLVLLDESNWEFWPAARTTDLSGLAPHRDFHRWQSFGDRHHAVLQEALRWLVSEARNRTEQADCQVVQILYGTDRGGTLDGEQDFSGSRGHRLRLGLAEVSVPTRRRRGRVSRPTRLFSIRLERENPDRHFVIQSTSEMAESEFLIALTASSTQSNTALLYVHGYNTTFEGALFRGAQLAVDLDVPGPMLVYSWPSRGSLLAYDYDADSVKQSREHFSAFMDLLSLSTLQALNIIAHSKGNELLLEMLNARPAEVECEIGEVVMASPDLDCDFALQLARGAAAKVRSMTLYACSEDLALRASRRKAGGVPRAGDLLSDGHPLIVPGVDSIDASASRLRLDEFNHNSFVADPVLRFDLAELLATGRRPPHKRSASITEQGCSRGVYWRLESE